MNDKNTKLLEDAIEQRLNELSYVNFENDEMKTATEATEKLIKLSIEMDKNKKELEEKRIARVNEEALKVKQLKSEQSMGWVNIGVTALTTAATLAFYIVFTETGFKFEETGTFVSPTFKNLISNFKLRIR